jgi:hypothetical protein
VAPAPTLARRGRTHGTVAPPHRSTEVLSISGGSLEIMKDLASRQLGY